MSSDKQYPEMGETLTAEELRIRLYNKFRDKGILNEMRSQLRNRLLTEFHSISRVDGEVSDSIPEDALLIRITNWFVAEHLQVCKYYSTLSVFVTESKSLDNSQNIISLKDVLNLLQIHPGTRLHQTIMEAKEKRKHSSILTLMLHLMGVEFDLEKKQKLLWREDQAVQTEALEDQPYSFQQKLQEIEDLYTLKKGIQKIEDEKSVEFQLIKYRQQLEESIRKESKEEMNAFKDKELLRIKLEIQEKSLKENQAYRRQLEQDYQKKFAALVAKEKKDMEEMNMLKENVEKEIYLQRQEVLEHLEAARQKEIRAQKLQEKFLDEKNVDKEKLKLHEQKLKMMEENLLQEERQLNNKVKTLVAKERLQEQIEYNAKVHELNEEKTRLSLLEKELRNKKELVDEKQSEYDNSMKQMQELQEKLSEYEAKVLAVRKENTELIERLKIMPEIERLRSDYETSKLTVNNLKHLLEDTENEKNKLKTQLVEMRIVLESPSPEVLKLKREVEKMRDSYQLDQAVWDEHRARLENHLKSAHDQNQILSERLQQKSRSEKELQDRIHELHNQLQHMYTQTYKIMTPRKTDDNKEFVIETSVANEQNTFFDTTINPNTVPLELQLQGGDGSRGDNLAASASEPHSLLLSPNNDVFFLHQSENRVLALQKEADYLDRYCEVLQKNTRSGLKVSPDKQLVNSTPKLDTRFYSSERFDRRCSSPNLRSKNLFETVPHSPWNLISELKTEASKQYHTIPYTDTFAWDFSYKPSTLLETSTSVSKSKKNILESAKETENVLHSTLLSDEENYSFKYQLPVGKEKLENDKSEPMKMYPLLSLVAERIEDSLLQNDNNKEYLSKDGENNAIKPQEANKPLIELDDIDFTNVRNEPIYSSHLEDSTSSKKQDGTGEFSILTTRESETRQIDDKEIPSNRGLDDKQSSIPDEKEMVQEKISMSTQEEPVRLQEVQNESTAVPQVLPQVFLPHVDLEAQWKMKRQSSLNEMGHENTQGSPVGDTVKANDDDTQIKEETRAKSPVSLPKNEKFEMAASVGSVSPEHSEHFSAGTFNPSSGDDDW